MPCTKNFLKVNRFVILFKLKYQQMLATEIVRMQDYHALIHVVELIAPKVGDRSVMTHA